MSLRQILRRQKNAPLFALTVTLLVAAVVAVNATAFSAIHALRWKALPYADGDRLVELQANLSAYGLTVGLTERLRRQVADDASHFSGALGFSVGNQLRQDESGQRWRVARVTEAFAGVLGASAALGRTFAIDDMREGGDSVLVLSDAAWQAKFSRAADVVGRIVRFDGESYTVIGVMPRNFVFPDSSVDAWRPYVMSTGERAQSESGNVGDLDVVARLAAGVSVDQARGRLQAIMVADASMAGLRTNAGLKSEARPWRDRFAASYWHALALLQLAALILLVVVAANLVNINLDRLLGRMREFEIRRAMGADERAILGGVVSDLAPPVLAGLAIGLIATPFGFALAERHDLLPASLPQGSALGIVTLVAGAVVATLALGTGALALIVSRRSTSLSSRAGAGGLGHVRPAMIVAQVMLTTALLGGAGLLLRSAVNLMHSERGFDASGVLLTVVDPVGVSISGRHYDAASDYARYAPLVEALRADIAGLPGVQHVAIASAPPFSQWEMVSNYRNPGQAEPVQARARRVGPDYFAALGIELIAGREFGLADRGEASPVVVDEAWSEHYLQGVDPMDAYVEVPIDDEGNMRRARIIGVARSVKHERLDEAANLPTVYQFAEAPLPVFWLVTRTAGDTAALAETVRKRVLVLAPSSDIGVNQPLAYLVDQSLAAQRSLLGALGTFAAMTLILAALGLGAMLSFAIRRRTSELGLRLAIGATPARVRNLVLRQGGKLIVAGALLGLAVGIPLSRLFADRLYGVSFNDAMTWLVVVVVIVAVALFACWLPARRAARVDPMVALRSE